MRARGRRAQAWDGAPFSNVGEAPGPGSGPGPWVCRACVVGKVAGLGFSMAGVRSGGVPMQVGGSGLHTSGLGILGGVKSRAGLKLCVGLI